jgi:YrbI family 3-deoxy-D-manno-octulosonate 8-phosphate phosphatase
MEQNSRHIVACLPLRGGSRSIPLKNVREIAGRPLAYWVLDALCGCNSIRTVYVSTDSDDIAYVIKDYNHKKIHIIDRSPETATDTASTESALIEFAREYACTDVVLVQATSPLLDATQLSAGIEKYLTAGADSLLSVVRQKRFVWKETDAPFATPMNYDPLKRPRRQDWEGFLVENGAFYITSRNLLLEHSSRLSGKTAYYEMPAWTYVELDEPSDWLMAETLLRHKQYEAQSSEMKDTLKNIKLLVMDVDGVLTDAGMYYSESGQELKKFNTKDGKGIELINNLGIKTAFLTSETTALVEQRAKKLNIDFLIQGAKNKPEALHELINTIGITPAETAYMGDDINDTDAMNIAGFSATPADGVEQNKKIASYVCTKKGGEGCVREVCDLILGAKK